MAKHRRTRKEKMAGDRRTSSSPQIDAPISQSSPLFTINQPAKPSAQSILSTSRLESSHLLRDLAKTALLTSSIVIAELVLAFIIKV